MRKNVRIANTEYLRNHLFEKECVASASRLHNRRIFTFTKDIFNYSSTSLIVALQERGCSQTEAHLISI